MTTKSEVMLGFDFGLRRIGVASGSRLTGQANPLPTLLAKQGEPDWTQIEHLLRTWRPKGCVVGLPTHIDGTEQYTTIAARAFAAQLTERFGLEVFLVDERLSTVEARSTLFEQGGYKKIKNTQVDGIAACIILEQWLKQA